MSSSLIPRQNNQLGKEVERHELEKILMASKPKGVEPAIKFLKSLARTRKGQELDNYGAVQES